MDKNNEPMLKAFRAYAEDQLSQDLTGHGLDHIHRVVHLAKRLAEIEGADSVIVEAAALLHDVIDDKLTDEPQKQEAAVREFLRQQDPKLEPPVMEIITRMSFRKNLKQKQSLSLEGQVVQDADRLDAIGAIGIGRTFYYNGHAGNKIYDPQILPRTSMDEAQYGKQQNTVINHFYEKLLLLEDQMNTSEARRIAHTRTEFMRQFLTQFYLEWEGQDNL